MSKNDYPEDVSSDYCRTDKRCARCDALFIGNTSRLVCKVCSRTAETYEDFRRRMRNQHVMLLLAIAAVIIIAGCLYVRFAP